MLLKKVLTCILSLLPLLSYASMIIVFPAVLIADSVMGFMDNDIASAVFLVVMMGYAMWLVIILYAVMLRDIVTICKKKDAKTETMAIWCVLLFMFNMWAFPVFWFMYDRKK